MTYRTMISCCLLLLGSCVAKDGVPGGGPEVPPGLAMEPVSVARLRSLYRGYPVNVDGEWELHAVVTANDRFGALTNMFYVQDSTGGIAIKAGGGTLHADFPVGRPLRVRCRELALGGYGGSVSLGAASDDPLYENTFIPQAAWSSYFRPDGESLDVRPDTLAFGTLDARREDCLVAFTGVQFIGEENGVPWCDADADTERHLVDECGDTLVVRTSHRAVFGGQLLPCGSGYIEGILGRFAGRWQLRVVSPKNVVMDSARFTPRRTIRPDGAAPPTAYLSTPGYCIR